MSDEEKKCCEDHAGYEIEYVCADCGQEMCMLCKWHHGKEKGEYLCSFCGNTKTGIDASTLRKIRYGVLGFIALLAVIYYLFIVPAMVEKGIESGKELQKLQQKSRTFEEQEKMQRRIQEQTRPNFNP